MQYIRYDKLIDQAMRLVVKDVIKDVETHGLRGEHYFLISFLTRHKEVEIPQFLRNKYPNDMAIILQHQFEISENNDKYFIVKLSFHGSEESLKIPYDSIISFSDPGTDFGLKFNLISHGTENYLDLPHSKSKASEIHSQKTHQDKEDKYDDNRAKQEYKNEFSSENPQSQENSNVIDLAQFRAKNKKD